MAIRLLLLETLLEIIITAKNAFRELSSASHPRILNPNWLWLVRMRSQGVFLLAKTSSDYFWWISNMQLLLKICKEVSHMGYLPAKGLVILDRKSCVSFLGSIVSLFHCACKYKYFESIISIAVPSHVLKTGVETVI